MIRAVAFDGDGTTYRGEQLIEEVIEVMDWLKQEGVAVYLASNTSSRDAKALYKKLRGAVDEKNIITSVDLMIDEVKRRKIKRVWPICSDYIMERWKKEATVSEDAEVVCVSHTKKLDYWSFKIAMDNLFKGAELFVANMDRYYSSDAGLVPGTGMLARALSENFLIKPVVFGKPEPRMLIKICEKEGIQPSQLAMVGDMLETDVGAARRAGCVSIYIDSGIPQLVQERPDYRTSYDGLKHLLEKLI